MEFIEARHDDVEGTALLPETAFAEMPGWKPVSPDRHVPSPADGTVAEVLAHVGQDPARARAALLAEQAGKNRSTLVEQLTQLAHTGQEA